MGSTSSQPEAAPQLSWDENDERGFRRSFGRVYATAEIPEVILEEQENSARSSQVSERGGEQQAGRVKDDDPEDAVTHTPSLRELQKHMGAIKEENRAKFARGLLLFANAVSLIFASLLIYYGSAGATEIDLSKPQEAFSAVGEEIMSLGGLALDEAEMFIEHGYVKNILRPYQLVLALGVALLLLSIAGFLGSACPSRRIGKEILFGYFSTVLVFVCVLMWGSVLCFQYQNETKRYLERQVDSHWGTIGPLVHQRKKTILYYIEDNSNLIISGAFCIVSAFVMTAGLWAASRTMGHYFTVKKVMVSCSISGIFSGLVLVALSIYYGAKNIGGQWAPGVTAVSGIAIFFLSALGIYGVRSESMLALVLHLFLMCMLSLFVSIVGVLVIAYPHVVSDLVHQNWKMIRENLTERTEKHFRNEIADNLLLLGSASILFAVLLLISAAASFSACLETYRKKRSAFLTKLEVRSICIK
mmetsp:Transcript_1231/g.2209  ORF Transcript_1231/g.2209 Transcript_1231/m.2209 type:complete len:473 (+) Transcript_1231:336-1754(+)|eukprot:CAMPEP_0197474576 /NCGR_PEP_ID=MMETSP1309-20131121/6023_1 /TAXON_ID=464262 /ORGANISM="Genus nov. species nov., Strain RCC998" /LENGTH=472 /DNA_ID=CAMNT_0043014269 /DNA_START=528 /DNA_END=1946 /DNA_ORIENTATION=-